MKRRRISRISDSQLQGAPHALTFRGEGGGAPRRRLIRSISTDNTYKSGLEHAEEGCLRLPADTADVLN